jgi:hypothetical protein
MIIRLNYNKKLVHVAQAITCTCLLLLGIACSKKEENPHQRILQNFSGEASQNSKSARSFEDAVKLDLQDLLNGLNENFNEFAKGKAGSGGLGFVNFGATCYANASNKLLWMMLTRDQADDQPLGGQEIAPGNGNIDQDLSKASFRGHLNQFFGTLATYLARTTGFESLDGQRGHTLRYTQQDAHEYLAVMLPLLETTKLFGGFEGASQITFDDGSSNPLRVEGRWTDDQGKVHRALNNNFPLVIDNPTITSVSKAVEAYLGRERVGQVEREENPAILADGYKKTYFYVAKDSPVPSRIVFSLVRFAQDDYGVRSKVEKNVQVESQLKVPFRREGSDTEFNLKLELMGAVNHTGSLNNGHYIAILYHATQGGTRLAWHQHNDGNVTQSSTKAAFEEMSANGYALLYRTVGIENR